MTGGSGGGGAVATGEAGTSYSFELKNMREIHICAAGTLVRADGLQDTNGHMLFIATHLQAAVLQLINTLKVPLHRTFLINVQLAVAALLRVGWMQAAALSSPFFHAFHSTAVTLSQHMAEQMATLTGEVVDAQRLKEGTLFLPGLALRSAQKTSGLMHEWQRVAQARLQKKPYQDIVLEGADTHEKARVSDDLDMSEEKDRVAKFWERADGIPAPKTEKPHWTVGLAKELRAVNDPERLKEEQETQKAWLKTGRMLPVRPKDGPAKPKEETRQGEGGDKLERNQHLPLSASFLQVDAVPNAWMAASAASRKRHSVNVEAAPSPWPSQSTFERAAYLAAAWNQTAHRTTNVTTAAALNMTMLGSVKFPSLLHSARTMAYATQEKLEELQSQVAGVAKIRFFLNKAQLMLGNFANHVAALKDNLACVRQEIEEGMQSGIVWPTWIIKLYGLLEFNGSVVWRLMLAILASRASAHSVGQRLLHACDTYALLLWQSLMARAAQLSPLGPYGGVEFLGTFQNPFANIADPRLILPG